MITGDPRSARWARTCWVVLVLTIVVLAGAGQGRATGQVPPVAVADDGCRLFDAPGQWLCRDSAPAVPDTCSGEPGAAEWPGTVPLHGGEHRVFSDAYATFLSRGCGLAGG